MSRIRRWLVGTAAVFAVAQLIDGIANRIPLGIVFAVAIGACAWWASRSNGWPAPAELLALAAVELLMVGFVYGRSEEPATWWRLALFGMLSLAVALIAAIDLATVIARRRQRASETPGSNSAPR
jgi:peptidoglycan/LPS O-acetylase OafA/YrhL